ncbi:hypothetical protein [Marinobacter sp. SS21]|uniref:hypothetical protein n=1 Tax=Marinobacter sp. SS21 TaxID=2979460 RepID=UPI00232EB317|nr:hypothetical protein [Marinobacter sp. SS21]MDC0664107.1 hypothetical protein [Marinobacter sp. SS21]
MTTASELKKLAKETITPFLIEKGFQLVKSYAFVRERSGMFDILDFSIFNGGWNLRPIVKCWVPELDPDFECSKFPKKLPSRISSGGYLNPFGEIAFGGGSWSIKSEEEVLRALSEIRDLLQSVALPWFDHIETKADLLDALNPGIRAQPNFDKIKDKLLSN